MPSSYYTSQSHYSDPGHFGEQLTLGDTEPRSLACWINSILQHPRGFETEKLGFTSEQATDLELRSVSDILAMAAKRSLPDANGARPKVGGVCRDFALMAVSAFRKHDIPARLRVGFADYLVCGRWEDHWLCEWHDGGRWKRLDVEFEALGGLTFDTSDVPSERFLTASEAWFQIQEDPEIAGQFGVSGLKLAGEWFVAGSLLREMAALRKLELKPWDYWGLSRDLSPVSPELPHHASETFHQLASQLRNVGNDGCDEPLTLVDWALPEEVLSFPRGEPMIVRLPII